MDIDLNKLPLATALDIKEQAGHHIDFDRDFFMDEHLGFLCLVLNMRHRGESARLHRGGYIDIPLMSKSPDVAFTDSFKNLKTSPAAWRAMQWNDYHRRSATAEVSRRGKHLPRTRHQPELLHNNLVGSVNKKANSESGKVLPYTTRMNIYQIFSGPPHADAEDNCFHEAFEAVVESNFAALENTELFYNSVFSPSGEPHE